MTSARADAIFFMNMVRRGRITPERAIEDLGMPGKLEKLVRGFAEKDAEFAATIDRIAEHRRAAVEELRRLLMLP